MVVFGVSCCCGGVLEVLSFGCIIVRVVLLVFAIKVVGNIRGVLGNQ